jgi:hypothetical protein
MVVPKSPSWRARPLLARASLGELDEVAEVAMSATYDAGHFDRNAS